MRMRSECTTSRAYLTVRMSCASQARRAGADFFLPFPTPFPGDEFRFNIQKELLSKGRTWHLLILIVFRVRRAYKIELRIWEK